MSRLQVFGAVVLLFVAAPGFPQPAPQFFFVQPTEVILPVGVSQQFQILDGNGIETRTSRWSVSDSAVAELRIEDGRATLIGKTPGRVVLTGASGARSGEIRVQPADLNVPDARWLLRPIDGLFLRVLWSSSAWGASIEGRNFTLTAPAYYYEDRGDSSSHIRAVRADGLQLWQWPATRGSREVPRLLSGDFYGGVMLSIGVDASRVLVNLDPRGRERWRRSLPGFDDGSVNITPAGIVFVLVHEQGRERLLGLDGKTGDERWALSIDRGAEQLVNLRVVDGRPVCSAEARQSEPLPFRYSSVMTNVNGVTSLAYSVVTITADGGNCTPGAAVASADIHLHVVSRLIMLDVDSEAGMAVSTSTLQRLEADGDAATTWIEAIEPAGDVIPGADGTGNIVAIQKSRRRWLQTGATPPDEFLYRVTAGRRVEYQMPLPVANSRRTFYTLLGHLNKVGFTTRGRTLVAFEPRTGQELWRWVSDKADVIATGALADGSVLLREGDAYVMVNDGRVTGRRSEEFILFVMKFRPDFGER